MAFFQVTANELIAKADELEQLNSNFKTEVAGLEETEIALKNQWVGQANEAFHQAFTNDKTQMEAFNRLITEYVNTLRNVAKQYIQAEAKNMDLASKRSY